MIQLDQNYYDHQILLEERLHLTMEYLADQLLFRTIPKKSLQTIFFFVIFVVINHNMQNFMIKNCNRKIAAHTALNEFVDI